MSVVWVGQCDRCKIVVNHYPGLGYADREGRFGYCESCLRATGLGYKEAFRRGSVYKNAIWLEDVLENCTLSKTFFFLMHAESDWHKLKNVSCKKCSPHKLKTVGCQCK